MEGEPETTLWTVIAGGTDLSFLAQICDERGCESGQCEQRWAVHAVRVREEVKERVEIREVYDSTKEREGLREVREIRVRVLLFLNFK